MCSSDLSTQQLDRAHRNVILLTKNVEERKREILRLETKISDPAKPDGFMENDGRIRYPLPCDNGAKVVPRWIKRTGTGEVEMLAGLVEGEAVYVAQLFMDPDYTNDPVDAMEPWFLRLLQGPEAAFHTLAQAAQDLPDWEPYAEVIQYRRLDDDRREVKAELEELSAHV